jgi:hypothetical protein
MARKGRRKVKIRTRRSLRDRLRAVPRPLKGGLVLAAAAALLVAGARAARRHARASAAFHVRVDAVTLRGLPAWLDPAGREELLHPPPAVLPPLIHLLDRRPLARLAAYLEVSEWVAAVERLEYVFPGGNGAGGIVGSVVLNEPLCLVACAATRTLYYADAEGRRLGGALPGPPDRKLRLPVIYWARDVQVPERGEPWREERIRHGFCLAALVGAEDIRFAFPHWVERIDVTAAGRIDRSEIVLVTDNRVSLHWGRSPRSEHFGRTRFAESSQKIDRLTRVLAGEVPAGPGEKLNLFEPLKAQRGETGWLSARPP